jgi:hypothetical protein
VAELRTATATPAPHFFEGTIDRGDLCAEILGACRLVNEPTGGGSAHGEQPHIVVVEAGEKPAQFILGSGRGERVAVGSGGQRKALGYSDPLAREHRIKLAERRGLAPDFGNGAQPDIAKPADIGLCRHRIHSPDEPA